jgi:crotonobetainyl-CoA:carnitine CoA-transferase CaiB-like acyl-CoA transferase
VQEKGTPLGDRATLAPPVLALTLERCMQSALAGIRILGVTNWLSGAYAEQLLADMGAEVLRVEKPGIGDDSRQTPPFYQGESTTYLYPNRNKKSITLNLKDPAGAALLKRLILDFDVLVENNRPGVMEKFGLGYDTLSTLNPGLVMTSISGFGQTGPYRDRPAYDMNLQAITGLMSLTGEPGGRPLRTGVALCDYLGGLNAAYATLAALTHKHKTGEGQHVDVSLYESTIAIFGTALQDYLLMGNVRSRNGNRFGKITPSDTYACKDGWILITAANDGQWARLATVLGLHDGATDPRFASASARSANCDLLDSMITKWTATQSVCQADSILSAVGVPSGPVNTIADLVADPQFKHRNVVAEVTHPHAGPLSLVAAMPKLSRTPGRVVSAPPLLGEHNLDVYGRQLGLNNAQLAQLKESGVI